MKSTVEEKGTWEKAIAITLEPEEVSTKIDQMVSRYQKKAQFPGFRRGKAPADMVRSAFWTQIEREVLEALVPEAIEEAIEEHELKVATPPRVEGLHFHPGEPMTFTALVELWPEIEVSGTEGLDVDELIFEVQEEELEQFLDAIRERATQHVVVERPSQPGDFLEVVLQATDAAGKRLPSAKRQDLRLEAGGESLLPEFREATLGAVAGQRQLIRVEYPTDFNDRSLAGQVRHFDFRVEKVLERRVPNLDDAFAQSMGQADLAALRADARAKLEAREALEARQRTQEVLVEKLIEQNPFDVPPGLVERSVANALSRAQKDEPGVDEEQFREVFTPRVTRAWKRRILLDSIARKEAIQVTDDELEEHFREIGGPNSDPARMRRRFESAGELAGVRTEVLDGKVLGWLRERASVREIRKPRQSDTRSNIIQA